MSPHCCGTSFFSSFERLDDTAFWISRARSACASPSHLAPANPLFVTVFCSTILVSSTANLVPSTCNQKSGGSCSCSRLSFPFGASEPPFRHGLLLDYTGFLDSEFSPVNMQPKIRGIVFLFPLNLNVLVTTPFEVLHERIDRDTFMVNFISL